MSFKGFSDEAVEFYRELADNNTKAFWQSHKHVYDDECAAPMEELLTELEPEFGEGRLLRPYRDVRFSKDKSPYKTECSAHVGSRGYVSLSTEGLYVGGGCHGLDPAGLKQFREAVDADKSGAELERIVSGLRRKGYEVGGETLKTIPRGFDLNHPREGLLRHKDLYAGRLIPAGSTLASRRAFTSVKQILTEIRPLAAWFDRYCPDSGR